MAIAASALVLPNQKKQCGKIVRFTGGGGGEEYPTYVQ
jgi:hypothetical protein